jgi:hypothetical protein
MDYEIVLLIFDLNEIILRRNVRNSTYRVSKWNQKITKKYVLGQKKTYPATCLPICSFSALSIMV